MPTRKPKRATGKTGGHDWEKQMRFDMEYAKRTLLQDGQCRPMFVIHTPDIVIPVLTDFDDKERTRKIVRLMCIAHDAIGLVFIGEAWIKDIWGNPDARQRPGESWGEWEERIGVPSEAPDRIEVVTVQSAYYDDATGERTGKIEIRVIERDARGKPSGLGRVIQHTHGIGPDDEIKGPTFEILPERRSPPQARDAASELLDAMGIHKTPLSSGTIH